MVLLFFSIHPELMLFCLDRKKARLPVEKAGASKEAGLFDQNSHIVLSFLPNKHIREQRLCPRSQRSLPIRYRQSRHKLQNLPNPTAYPPDETRREGESRVGWVVSLFSILPCVGQRSSQALVS